MFALKGMPAYNSSILKKFTLQNLKNWISERKYTTYMCVCVYIWKKEGKVKQR